VVLLQFTEKSAFDWWKRREKREVNLYNDCQYMVCLHILFPDCGQFVTRFLDIRRRKATKREKNKVGIVVCRVNGTNSLASPTS